MMMVEEGNVLRHVTWVENVWGYMFRGPNVRIPSWRLDRHELPLAVIRAICASMPAWSTCNHNMDRRI